MASFETSTGRAKELSLSWCRKSWLNCQDTKRLLDTVVTASSIYAGFDAHNHDGSALCIGRALCNSEWCPGYFYCKLNGSIGNIFVASLDYCSRCEDFEVLTSTNLLSFGDQKSHRWMNWQACKQVPQDSLIGGTRNGQPIYIARTMVNDVFIVGGFVPNLQVASFNYQMTLILRKRDFDLLVMGCRTAA